VQSFIASTGKISSILRTVEDISRQMELLAFNALVESRRAGLEGRSFGVIASAFRELADSSKREVKDIRDVMGSIDAESARLTEMISRNAESVKQCAAHSGRITDGLGAIDLNFAAVSDALAGVQRHADDQGRIAERISAGVQDIERNSEQVVAGMDSIHAAVQKQKAGMDELSGVGRHLVNASQSLSQFVRDTQSTSTGMDRERVTQAAQAVFAQMDSAVLSNGAFYSMDAAVHKRLLDGLMSGGTVESVWSNHASGRFVYSNPPAGISNARIRPWFRESAAGRSYVSDVYVSAITHRPCVTVAVPVMQSGRCIGVLGADLKLG
jgi:methyl-accepting chemotaxis protein